MKQCPSCGSQLPEHARFCSHCGQKQENDEEKRRRGILPPPLPMERGASTAAPIVQGTPQISRVPTLQGTPTFGSPSPAPIFTQQAASSASSAAPWIAGSAAKVIIAVVIVGIIVLGGIGAYALSRANRPQTTIGVTSAYKVGATPAGSTGTVFQLTGQQFSNSSAISILLDGNTLPGKQKVLSSTTGSFRATLVVTDAWSLGQHLLSARDARNTSPKNAVPIIIVRQGQANTPGLDGAPPDDASFTLNININGQDASGNQFTNQATLNITGHPDPTGGTVCRPRDNGQTQTYTSTTVDTGETYKETYTLSCSGTYKDGKITFAETFKSDVVVFTGFNPPTTCTLKSSHLDEQLTGSYTGQHTFTGTINYPEIPRTDYACNSPNSYFFFYAGHGTWTGKIAK